MKEEFEEKYAPTKGFERLPLTIVGKLQALEVREFEAEDSDDLKDEYGRSLGRIRQSIQSLLSKADPNEEMHNKIYHICCVSFSIGKKDRTFKPICDALRKLGYEIIEDKKEQKAIILSRKKVSK